MDYITEKNRKEGLTVLMVSHDMELVQEYAGRVLVLHDGKLEGDGPVKTIMKDMDVLKKAHVLPAQIPMLAFCNGAATAEIYTVEEMADAIAREREHAGTKKGGAAE